MQGEVDGLFAFSTTSFGMDPASYYIGVSFGNDNYIYQQELFDIAYYYDDIQFSTEISSLTANMSTDLTYCGYAINNGNAIGLTSAGPMQFAIANLNYLFSPNTGFVAQYTWMCHAEELAGEG